MVGKYEDDPYFEIIPTQKKVLGMGGTKKIKRRPNPLLTEEEKQIRNKVRDRAWSLDMALFRIPWVGRFGWSSVIGLIPVVGDMLDSVLALLLIRTCNSVQPPLPSKVIWLMYWNLAFDFLIGLVPLLGDLADAAYKCNTKNFVLLEKELERRVKERQAQTRGPNNPRGRNGGAAMDLEAGNAYG